MKKIGLVAPFMLPEVGGANIYCFELARALATLDLEVHLFCPPDSLEDPAFVSHPILTRDLSEDLARLDAFEMDAWHSLYFFYAPLALHRPRVFVTGHGDDFFSLRLRFPWGPRAWLRRNLNWRLPTGFRESVEQWTLPLEMRHNRGIFSEAVRRCRQVIAVSGFSRDRFCEAYPTALGKTTVIPPGVAEVFFERPNLSPRGCRRLLTVTRLDEEDRIKNVHGVVAALGELKNDFDFEYHVVAGKQQGAYRAEIDALIALHGLQDRVRIHGRLPLAELIEHYRQADLFLLVSYAEPDNFEGFGIVFLEANAAGTPVLTSRQGGMSDYVQEKQNGFYVDDPSAAGIARALRRFFSGEISFDPNRVVGFPQDYRWQGIARQVAAVYERYWD